MMGTELFVLQDGKQIDAALHAEFLENERAEQVTAAAAIDRAIADGMTRDEAVHFYGYRGIEKYNPNQPRDPKGTDTGGQWRGGVTGDTPEEAARFENERLVTDGPGEGMSRVRVMRDSGLWGGSHSGSSTITGYSAKVMGIEGYKDWGADKRAQQIGDKFLSAVAEGRTAGEKLYHGFRNTQGIDWKEGDTLKLPLTASTGDADSAAGYGISYTPEADNSGATVFEFPEHTAMVGYSRWDRRSTQDFGHTWGEAIVAGEFRIKGTRMDKEGGWRKLSITIVELEPTALFDPVTKGWKSHG